MRINVYNEEITNDFEFVEKHVTETGKTYYGFRFMLKSAPELHNTPTDDDRTAVTIWFGTREKAKDWLNRAWEFVSEQIEIAAGQDIPV